jgi:hypothetical protein
MPKPANQPGKQPAKPDILPPETTPTPAPGIAPALASKPTLRQRAERLCSDENLDFFAHLLDDWFRLPFTPIRVGLDGLIGLIPGLGDILAGIASFVLVFAAWIRGVPYVTLLRMMVNIAIEVLIGSIPLFGDIFDIAWKANRRNYQLLARHIGEPHRHTGKDWVFLFLLACALGLIFAIPLLLLLALIVWIGNALTPHW